MTVPPPGQAGRGARLIIPIRVLDALAVDRAFAWLASEIEQGRVGILVVPTVRYLGHGGIVHTVLGAAAGRIALVEGRVTMVVDAQTHRAGVLAEHALRPSDYVPDQLALALLWPSDLLVRRVEREAPGADVLTVPSTAEQTDRWIRALKYEPVPASRLQAG